MSMKLTYIYHSCYSIETDDFAIIFDYYKDSGKSPFEGYVHDELLKKEKPLWGNGLSFPLAAGK